MKRSIAALALFAAAFSLVGEEAASQGSSSFSLSGAVAPRLAFSAENADSAFSGLSPFSDSSAAGIIDGKLSFSRDYRSLGLLDFSFADDAVLAHEGGSTLESMSLTVNELYADLNFGDLLFLRLGKQRLSWGSGFVFNPSDPVNPPKDPTSRRAVREGVPSLKAEIIAKPLSLTAFAVLHDSLDETGYGAKLSTSAVPNTDLAVSGYWSPSQSWTAALNLSSAPLYDLPGWDAIQIWLEGCLYDEARYAAYAEGSLPGSASTAKARGLQYAALAGISAQLPVVRTVALCEYYHLSEGLAPEDLAAVYRALRDPATRSASLPWAAELGRRPGRQARDYLFASLSQPSVTDSGDPVLDKIGLSASCILNLDDLSFYASGGVGLSFVKDSSVDLSVNWAKGGEESEFGNSPASLSYGLELKVFF
jgi:hypothetical protein